MAETERERIVANPGKRKMSAKQAAIFGRTPAIRAAAQRSLSHRKNSAKKASSHRPRSKKRTSNPGGQIVGFRLRNNAAERSSGMAKTKKKKSNKSHHKKNTPKGYALMRGNPGKMFFKQNKGHKKRKNPSEGSSGLAGMVTNAVFVIVGALGSKLGAQMVLGSNNTGLIGYAGNAAIGAAMWLLTEHVMKNRQASSGVIAGTLVQIILRAINDFTPFGSYVSGLGFGDYQMQSFVTPQVLVDPWNSAQILIPNGWGAPTPVPLPAAAASAAALPPGHPAAAATVPGGSASSTSGMSGMYGATYGNGWGSLYGG
jgi:hypothetical protein